MVADAIDAGQSVRDIGRAFRRFIGLVDRRRYYMVLGWFSQGWTVG